MSSMGYYLGNVDKGCCEVILPYSDGITNQVGGFHGGAIGAIGDIAAGYAGLTMAPDNMEVTTVEYKINFMSAYQGGSLVAVGRVAKAGKKLIVTTAEIFHLTEHYDPMAQSAPVIHGNSSQGIGGTSLPKGKICAILQQTLCPIPKNY
ncbi:PaaI family thioesterase [archaeon]|nr:MAG: PaaI family thioesterase [archaeon]